MLLMLACGRNASALSITEEADGHGYTLSNKSREIRDASSDSVSSGAGGNTRTRVKKVKDELLNHLVVHVRKY